MLPSIHLVARDVSHTEHRALVLERVCQERALLFEEANQAFLLLVLLNQHVHKLILFHPVALEGYKPSVNKMYCYLAFYIRSSASSLKLFRSGAFFLFCIPCSLYKSFHNRKLVFTINKVFASENFFWVHRIDNLFVF